jgi:hypothetical protein
MANFSAIGLKPFAHRRQGHAFFGDEADAGEELAGVEIVELRAVDDVAALVGQIGRNRSHDAARRLAGDRQYILRHASHSLFGMGQPFFNSDRRACLDQSNVADQAKCTQPCINFLDDGWLQSRASHRRSAYGTWNWSPFRLRRGTAYPRR